jgi:hypothetical protein
MELADFRTILETAGTSGVKQVFLGYQEKPNIEVDKLYPFVLWDYNTWEGVLNSRKPQETIKIRAYIVQYYDANAGGDESIIEDVFDELRAIFVAYLAVINTGTYVQVTNREKLPYRLYNRGLWLDSEVGISYDVEFKLFC